MQKKISAILLDLLFKDIVFDQISPVHFILESRGVEWAWRTKDEGRQEICLSYIGFKAYSNLTPPQNISCQLHSVSQKFHFQDTSRNTYSFSIFHKPFIATGIKQISCTEDTPNLVNVYGQ